MAVGTSLPRGLLCALFALLWTECSSYGISPGIVSSGTFARRATVQVPGKASILAEAFHDGRLRSGARESAFTVTCSGKGNAEPSESKIGAVGSKIAGLGRRFREKCRRGAAFGTDVVLHPLKELLYRDWSSKFVLFSGTEEEFAKLKGRVALVTGGSGGIGLQAATGLAARGFQVVIACRDAEKGRKAVQQIESLVPYSKGKVEVLPLDLSSLDSVRQMASMFGSRKLDVLVNNAGYGGGGPGGITADKLEWYFQVNHLGHFLLTHLLWPNLAASKGRVVSVSSVMHWKATKCFPSDASERSDMLTSPTAKNGGEYRRSKLFNLLFTYGLARRFPPSSYGGVSAHAVNPGFVYSDIWRHEKSERLLKVYKKWCKTTAQGAEGIIRAATEDGYGDWSGGFLVDARPSGSSALAQEEEPCDWLWGVSEGLAGIVTFGSPAGQPVVTLDSPAGDAAIDEEDEDLDFDDSEVSESLLDDWAKSAMQKEKPAVATPAVDRDALKRESEAVQGMSDVSTSYTEKLRDIRERAGKSMTQRLLELEKNKAPAGKNGVGAGDSEAAARRKVVEERVERQQRWQTETATRMREAKAGSKETSAAPAPAAAAGDVNLAKKNTLSANKAQWSITEPAKPAASSPAAAPAATRIGSTQGVERLAKRLKEEAELVDLSSRRNTVTMKRNTQRLAEYRANQEAAAREAAARRKVVEERVERQQRWQEENARRMREAKKK